MKPNDLSKYKLIIFDLDGTLVEDYHSEELLPPVRRWLRKHGRDHLLGIASNQGGVGLRYWMELGGFGDPDEYPTAQSAAVRAYRVKGAMLDIIRETKAGLHHPISLIVSFAYQSKNSGKWGPVPPLETAGDARWHPLFGRWEQEYRKPAPGMIRHIMYTLNVRAEDGVLFVGDRPEDQEAAQNAGVDFIEAREFFRDYR